MSNGIRWQSGTATMMALAITAGAIAPLFSSKVALAQNRFPNPSPNNAPSERLDVFVPTGTTIAVGFDEAEKIVIAPQETKSLTLRVARPVTNSNGTVLIPVGSQLIGQLQPAPGGSQFVAKELIIRPGRRFEQRYSINGSSSVVTRTEQISKGADVRGILKGAAIGAAAGAALGALTGDHAIATEELLGGAGLGAVGGLVLNRRKVDVVVVRPNEDLAVKLDSELALR